MSNKNQNQKVEEELKNQQHTDKNAQAAAESQEAEAQKAQEKGEEEKRTYRRREVRKRIGRSSESY